ncbi:hypothetical protein PPBDW_I21779 [Photobacterium kishitanii]|nr:hypothetical protein PPBDW_I21779 [Photobacterium kishitanii]
MGILYAFWVYVCIGACLFVDGEISKFTGIITKHVRNADEQMNNEYCI